MPQSRTRIRADDLVYLVKDPSDNLGAVPQFRRDLSAQMRKLLPVEVDLEQGTWHVRGAEDQPRSLWASRTAEGVHRIGETIEVYGWFFGVYDRTDLDHLNAALLSACGTQERIGENSVDAD